IYEISLLEEKADGFLFGERGKYAPPGVLGGAHGARNRFTFEANSARLEPPMVSKMVGIKLKRGESVRLETPGGGGYGHPHERDPQLVGEDVRLGYVSSDAARSQYGCVVDSAGHVDLAATKSLRSGADR
ncbi:MAG: hydantoinase B/oxoprolinase family protein, partial [Fimbriimonadaceae bacterium]|nr:hydantoinase B/oxoprolinase family protein [Alphaproteobacteria bacterium]